MTRALMSLLFCAAAAFVAQSFGQVVPSTPSREAILKELRGLEERFGGHLGLMAKNLDTGEEVRYNADDRFPTASVIKLPVLAAMFHMVDEKRIDPSMKVVLTADDKKGGSGLFQFFSEGTTMTLLDAAKMMIIVSDNTGTNLVIDRLASTHQERLDAVNDFMLARGLKNTRLLNRLMSWNTKQLTPDAVRYGIGVTTPADMVVLLDQLYTGTLVDSASCAMMLEILKQQFYNDMIPRLLPAEDCKRFEVAHKTGFINESKGDVALVLSDRLNMAIAIFVDKQPDHREDIENTAMLLAAYASRAIWNHFTGSTGYLTRRVVQNDVDWTWIPGGRWAIYRSPAAPFPHKDRAQGWKGGDGTVYPPFPHYLDSSIVVFVPDTFKEGQSGSNVIVHFHGHARDNLYELYSQQMPQAMLRQGINALLVLPQGPYLARDSFGGKLEEEGGFARLVADVLETMRREGVVKSTGVDRVIVSAHSGGYRPAAYSLHAGGLADHVTDVFLFDAFYGNHDFFKNWLNRYQGTITAAYTDHLAEEHQAFEGEMKATADTRLRFMKSEVEHNDVVVKYFESWLHQLGPEWKRTTN